MDNRRNAFGKKRSDTGNPGRHGSEPQKTASGHTTLLTILATAAAAIIVLAIAVVPMMRANNARTRTSSDTGTAPESTSRSKNSEQGDDGNNQATKASDTVPTLYMHGWNGGRVSTDSMIEYAEQHSDATKVLTATISAKGEVKLTGTWQANAKRPLIQVLFQDNKNSDYGTTSEWFHTLIATLQKRYGITQYNTVAHSMGNMTAMYYAVDHGQDPSLPKLARQVNIAGNFDGIMGMDDAPGKNTIQADGSPSYQNQYYRYLLAHRSGYPDGVDVLNIFGNLDDGTNSDSSVSTPSAQSLGYLLRGKAKSYREIEVHGKAGQHSKLHENDEVTADIDDFLWPKS